ncbi:MAG: deoxyribodipyrimidine photolyase [Bacteroidetes bacterium RBG_13_46_8]|nr:MAG: deoxyribodipyrimidine photolyase [Bacteroidetes bacterium RBG_13_46_8]
MINPKRIRKLKDGKQENGPVVYWMSRDQRVRDNWALAYAVEKAQDADEPLIVVFVLMSGYPGATLRQYDFMLKGLNKLEAHLSRLNIPFVMLLGDPVSTLPPFITGHHISLLVTDFDPLRIKRKWKKDVCDQVAIPVYEVDAHNLIPCWIASDKEEYSAGTFRPKIHKLLPEFLDEFPPLVPFALRHQTKKNNWEVILAFLSTDRSVKPVSWMTPGETAAMTMLERFLMTRLANYAQDKNDPVLNATSSLSPYLHFGHLSAQRAALDILKNFPRSPGNDAFLEELIVRRELSDNFCYYNTRYDSLDGAKPWARKTLDEHRRDRREYVYTAAQFESALTHDELWNAAQREMRKSGRMHGYIRMYWAKKILEWSHSPEEALQTALYLNDKYELDGRDPNGYAGCMWSIAGIHDRAWAERNVFGKIRFMNRNGCERKFDVRKYLEAVDQIV